MIERRQEQRHQFLNGLQLTILDPIFDHVDSNAKIENYSKLGLKITTSVEYKKGDVLTVTVLNPQNNKKESADATVIWTEHICSSWGGLNTYHVGIKLQRSIMEEIYS